MEKAKNQMLGPKNTLEAKDLSYARKQKQLPTAGIEPASPRPQRGVLTTILRGPKACKTRDCYDPCSFTGRRDRKSSYLVFDKRVASALLKNLNHVFAVRISCRVMERCAAGLENRKIENNCRDRDRDRK